jgi:hypothetical protein
LSDQDQNIDDNVIGEVREQVVDRVSKRIESQVNEHFKKQLENESNLLSQAASREIEKLRLADHTRELLLKQELEKLSKAEELRQKNYNLEFAALEKVSRERKAKMDAETLQANETRTHFEARMNNINRPISIVGPLTSQPQLALKKSETRQILSY